MKETKVHGKETVNEPIENYETVNLTVKKMFQKEVYTYPTKKIVKNFKVSIYVFSVFLHTHTHTRLNLFIYTYVNTHRHIWRLYVWSRKCLINYETDEKGDLRLIEFFKIKWETKKIWIVD